MKHGNYLDRTLLALTNAARHFFFSEEHACSRGLLQSLNVRIKILSFVFILIVASFLHNPGTLWALHAVSAALAVFSGISLVLFLRRVWLFVPLFSAAVVLPAMINIVTPGDPMLVLLTLTRSYSWGPYTIPSEIAITHQGFHGAVLFISRVGVSVSFSILFMLTTRWTEVFSGLRGLFVPRVFVITLNLALRYLFVLLRLIQDMYRARKSRTIAPLPLPTERSWIASRIGITFRKSVDMSQGVYRAMISRGFHGEFPAVNRSGISRRDILWIVSTACLGGIMIVLERGFF